MRLKRSVNRQHPTSLNTLEEEPIVEEGDCSGDVLPIKVYDQQTTEAENVDDSYKRTK